MKHCIKLTIAGLAAGSIAGLLGAGGGMILVPLLNLFDCENKEKVFSNSVAIMLPLCFVSIAISPGYGNLPWKEALPYMIGAIPGGIAAALLSKKIPVKWLHRALGILILWGGVQYLC